MGRGHKLKKQAARAEAQRLKLDDAKYRHDLLLQQGYKVFEYRDMQHLRHHALLVATYPYDKPVRGQYDGGALRLLGDYGHGLLVEDRGRPVLVRAEYLHSKEKSSLWETPRGPAVVEGPPNNIALQSLAAARISAHETLVVRSEPSQTTPTGDYPDFTDLEKRVTAQAAKELKRDA